MSSLSLRTTLLVSNSPLQTSTWPLMSPDSSDSFSEKKEERDYLTSSDGTLLFLMFLNLESSSADLECARTPSLLFNSFLLRVNNKRNNHNSNSNSNSNSQRSQRRRRNSSLRRQLLMRRMRSLSRPLIPLICYLHLPLTLMTGSVDSLLLRIGRPNSNGSGRTSMTKAGHAGKCFMIRLRVKAKCSLRQAIP